jgi:DNA invertase Pin-like site-specific DNA recombinase
MSPLIGYYRVSTQKQGRSGLGLKAQRKAVAAFAKADGFEIVAQFTEVETGKGADALDRRPQLKAALKAAKKAKASVAVAKLDRLSRDVAFISGLMAQKVPFHCCRAGAQRRPVHPAHLRGARRAGAPHDQPAHHCRPCCRQGPRQKAWLFRQ